MSERSGSRADDIMSLSANRAMTLVHAIRSVCHEPYLLVICIQSNYTELLHTKYMIITNK